MFRSHGLGKQNNGLPCKYTGQMLTGQENSEHLLLWLTSYPLLMHKETLLHTKDVSHKSYLKYSLFFWVVYFYKCAGCFFSLGIAALSRDVEWPRGNSLSRRNGKLGLFSLNISWMESTQMDISATYSSCDSENMKMLQLFLLGQCSPQL